MPGIAGIISNGLNARNRAELDSMVPCLLGSSRSNAIDFGYWQSPPFNSGVTCDPRVVQNARKIPEIAYDEMLEMASLGSKVMQSRSVEFAKKFGVIFEVQSSFNDQPGTIVKEETSGMEKVVIRGVSIDRKQAKVTISHVPDKPGIASRIFSEIAAINVNVDTIVQNVSAAGTTDISFTTLADELPKIENLLGPIVEEIGAKGFTAQGGIAKLFRPRSAKVSLFVADMSTFKESLA